MGRCKVIFLDRDGVINKKALPHSYITRWEEFEILPGVCEAIRKCNKAGYYTAIVSNQRGIAKGICSRKQIDSLHEKMREYLTKKGAVIDITCICPHDNGECTCRKPEPGLLYMAEKQLWEERKEKVDKERSWMIGDFISDVKAGQAYGVKTVWIQGRAAYKDGTEPELRPDYIAESLYEAVDFILSWEKRMKETDLRIQGKEK